MSKNIIIVIIFVGIVIGIGFYFLRSEEEVIKPTEQFEVNTTLAPEVEAVINRKIEIVTDLMQSSIIIQAVEASNQRNKNLTLDEILQLDTKWRNAQENDEFINLLLTNDIAQTLIEFQENNLGFPEIFIADKYGLNVGQTNKTTDYYQADEDWWINAYAGGEGKYFHGPIEFDESARAEAIAIYVPIINKETKGAIGVAKAIIDLVSIKKEL